MSVIIVASKLVRSGRSKRSDIVQLFTTLPLSSARVAGQQRHHCQGSLSQTHIRFTGHTQKLHHDLQTRSRSRYLMRYPPRISVSCGSRSADVADVLLSPLTIIFVGLLYRSIYDMWVICSFMISSLHSWELNSGGSRRYREMRDTL